MRSRNRAPQMYLFLFVLLLSACNPNPFVQPPIIQKTPTPLIAGGEVVLSHSQILLHPAPLPSAADLQFGKGDWTLAAGDSASTRSVVLPTCCVGQVPVPLWFHSFASPLLSAPIIGDNHIYVLATDGFLHALNLQTGEEEWRVPVGGELASNGLALAHGLLYLALAGHYVAALDASTGQERWRFDTKSVVRSAPFVIGRVLLVAGGANSLYSLDALNGEEYWAFHSEDALAEFWPTRTTPAYADGHVFVELGASNEFNVLNVRTGRKVWETALGERMTGGPLLDEARGLVYIVTWSGRVVALDMRTGKLRWEYRLPAGSESSPALSFHLGLLYVGSFAGYLYALEADSGHLAWRVDMGSSVTTSPLVVQAGSRNWVFVAPQAGNCTLLDAGSGKLLQVWKLGELRASPIVAHNVLYQASLGDQGLFAFQL